MKRKTTAFLLLVIILASALYMVSPLQAIESSEEPATIFDIFGSLWTTSVALGDPVPGGPGGGGND